MKKNFSKVVFMMLVMALGSLCFAKKADSLETLFPEDRNGTTAVLTLAMLRDRKASNYCIIRDVSMADETATFDFCSSDNGKTFVRSRFEMSVKPVANGKIFKVEATGNEVYIGDESNWTKSETIILNKVTISQMKKNLTKLFIDILNADDDSYKKIITNIKKTESVKKYL